jgi:hypothetical protein
MVRKYEYYQKRRQKLIEHLGGKCVRCGFSDARALQVDHVHGGGVVELRQKTWQTHHKDILADTTGKYQVLCANCNWIKRHEQNEQPCSNRPQCECFVLEHGTKATIRCGAAGHLYKLSTSAEAITKTLCRSHLQRLVRDYGYSVEKAESTGGA